MDKQQVIFKDLGIIGYKPAWDLQEELVKENSAIKSGAGKFSMAGEYPSIQGLADRFAIPTKNYLLFCEHPPVYTLGKSGSMENVLLTEAEMNKKDIQFFNTNRGGDITFHGLEQIVGYPILDLEKFYTDVGKYLRNLEEVIIQTIGEYGIIAGRSPGETGVWIDPDIKGRERKICAMGIRCSRWITMHGFALNVNTDLGFFENIIPCGIQNKKVTSMEKELQQKVSLDEVKWSLKNNFSKIFNVTII
ncbi:MAG: lipoyl(octanoyl) transferase LipB [Ginsengibacter sp.]